MRGRRPPEGHRRVSKSMSSAGEKRSRVRGEGLAGGNAIYFVPAAGGGTAGVDRRYEVWCPRASLQRGEKICLWPGMHVELRRLNFQNRSHLAIQGHHYPKECLDKQLLP